MTDAPPFPQHFSFDDIARDGFAEDVRRRVAAWDTILRCGELPHAGFTVRYLHERSQNYDAGIQWEPMGSGTPMNSAVVAFDVLVEFMRARAEFYGPRGEHCNQYGRKAQPTIVHLMFSLETCIDTRHVLRSAPLAAGGFGVHVRQGQRTGLVAAAATSVDMLTKNSPVQDRLGAALSEEPNAAVYLMRGTMRLPDVTVPHSYKPHAFPLADLMAVLRGNFIDD